MAVLDWMLDSDPSIRWQVLSDLVDAPTEVVAAERARVATEGWGARLLDLQGEDGQWEGGALFPARRGESAGGDPSDQNEGQPWTATAYSLVLLRDLGVDPCCDRVRRAVALVRDHCRWEHAGQPFFSGEVEPCINGLTIAVGTYFDQDVDSVVARLLGEQLEDGGWNCWTEYGSVRSSFATTIRVLEGLLAHERATGGSAESIAGRRRGEAYLLERKLFRRKSSGEVVNPSWLQFSFPTRWHYDVLRALEYFREAGDPPDQRVDEAIQLLRSKRQPEVRGCWRTHIPAKSISCLKTAMVGPAGGTRFGRSVSSAGTSNQLAERPARLRSPAGHVEPVWLFRDGPYDVDVDGYPSKQELEAAHCWEADDRVPRRPEMTEFRRRLRYHQSRWREAQGHPIGSQPIAPRPDGGPARLVGSRLQLAYAQQTGSNFLTASSLDAVRARTSIIEPHQSFDHQRLWADLLSAEAMAFNLFGELAADLRLADRAVHTWWPDAPGTVREVRFAHSPGRFDPAYLNSLRAFDVAFLLDIGERTQGIVGLATKYHERMKSEIPKPSNLPRYREVAERSGIFAPGAIDAVKGRSELAVMWLEHLLLLSMVQHASGAWNWGRYVVVHPAGNLDFAEACARYRDLLVDQSTFSSVTVEGLLDADVLPAQTAAALRERYVLG